MNRSMPSVPLPLARRPGFHALEFGDFASLTASRPTRCNTFKLMKQFSHVTCRVFSFANSCVDARNRLSDDVVYGFVHLPGLHLGRRRGVVVSGVHRMNEVNARRARLVPGRVTVFGRVYHLGM